MKEVKSIFSGYYRQPTLNRDRIVFVSEDDLWSVPVSGGVAQRLSAGLGKATHPALSYDGQWLAFTSTEEGHSEVFVMPADGGPSERLTFLGCETRVIGWTRDQKIVFASNHQHAFSRITDIYTVDPQTREIHKIPCGPATHIDFDPNGRMLISRHGGTDLAYWKRYRGGRAGEIWLDRSGRGEFQKLLKWPANTARPFWYKDRIVFISDHQGIGHVYSVHQDGEDLQAHTQNRDFYARGLALHESRVAYHAGGDLYTFDFLTEPKPRKVEVIYRSSRTQLNRRFVSAPSYLEDFELHPNGERVTVSARGKAFSFDLWKGPVAVHGQEAPVRTRLSRFLKDGLRLVMVSDEGGEEALEIHDSQNRTSVTRLAGLELGRILDLKVSPVADEVLLVNHRNELIWVDLGKRQSKVLDRSLCSRIYGFNWSPDGRYVAYSMSRTIRSSQIRICDLKTSDIHDVTQPVLRDVSPFFDPSGDYLYFLSYRELDPVYDNLHFDLSFPRGCRPYLLTLRKDVLPPLSPDQPSRAARKDKDKNKDTETKARDAAAEPVVAQIEIDFDGIAERIVALPLGDGRYGQIAANKEKFFFTRLPIEGSLNKDWTSREPSARAHLEAFDFATEKTETLVNSVTSFRLSRDGKHIIYRSGNALRVIKSGEKPGRESDDLRRNGWLDLERVQIPVHPQAEWQQMYREAWRLQRDHFWTEDMSKVDWQRVYDRYRPLLDRVGTRSEVSDLIWEMQGELGTSHAYEVGGDYRPDPHYGIGQLGVDYIFDDQEKAYRLTSVLKGDLWDDTTSSPLARAGLCLRAGDFLLAIDGQPLSRELRPERALVQRAGRDVAVTFRRKNETEAQTRSVRTLRSEQKLRYREWVENNRRLVHERSGGKIGYIHIPNMGPFGYAEFHRSFLAEVDREGLIIDVRYNGGGHVSELLLEKLARRRIGYCKSRWMGMVPYPEEAPVGPMVALTNEYAGSDGDIFSHSFKLLGLGPLLGRRTWGGVIGISPSHSLVDGGFTTQPEYSFWFQDVGWKVENYGTEPDLEVDISPTDYVAGRDTQLVEALRVCLERTERHAESLPSILPKMEDGPDLSLP